MPYVIVLIGLICLILGVRQLTIFVNRTHRLIARIKTILESDRFGEIERLNDEVDELNYSYYDILDDLNERLIAVEQRALKEQNLSLKTPKTTRPSDVVSQSERQQIIDMIANGHDNRHIAKTLGIGVAKVDMIRNLHS